MTVKKGKTIFKKSIALLLSVLMMFTSFSTVLAVAPTQDNNPVAQNTDNKWNGTTGELIANNYDVNNYEKAILACTGLVGESYSVEVPTNDTEGLVSVDADTQTVTAKAYEADGFVWEPTTAVVKYTNADGSAGTDIKVSISKVGEEYVGRFTKPANSYRVEVTYSLYIPVEEDLQKLLLDAPYFLADGYSMTDIAANSLTLAVDAIQDKMDELRALYNGITYDAVYEGETVYSLTVALPEGKCKEAIGNIIADYDKSENGGQLSLAKDLAEYNKPNGSKVQFMMEHGATFKANIEWFYTQLATINAEKADLTSVAEQLKNIASDEPETLDGTIEGAKVKIDEIVAEINSTVEAGVQEGIDAAVKKAKDEYDIDISSLCGKTREDNAIYNEIQNQREIFEENAKSLDALAKYYDDAAVKFESNPSMAEYYRNLAAEYRNNANEVRTTGINALNALEAKIREGYELGDSKAAEISAKKTELDGMKTGINEKAEMVNEVVKNIGNAASAVRTFSRQQWEYIGKKLVKDDITAEEYKALDVAVKAALDINDNPLVEKHSDLDIKDKLLASETVITAMVDQYVVHVDVKANVIAKSSVNTSSTVSLAVVNTSFPMDKDTSADDIIAAITASGVENSALQQWDAYYNIGSDNYNRVISIQDKNGETINELGALTDDISYTITYSPKTLKINETYKEDGNKITEVPYGYNWRLPRPTETTKSYDYEINGVAHRENTIIRVVEDIEVSRSEGKAISSKTLAEVIADSKVPGEALSQKEKDVLNSNAFLVDTIFFRTPDSNDKLTQVTATDDGYKLVAQTMSAGFIDSDAEWVPVKAYPVLTNGNGDEIALTKNNNAYEGEFVCNEMFSSVQVVYQLSIEGVDATTVSNLVNIADDLVNDTAAQKATLDSLCNNNNFYENLGQVNKTILGTLGTVVKDMSNEAKNAINLLTEQCLDPATEKTYLYEYLTQYKSENGGIAYYYKGENASNIQKQIDLVNTYLPIVWNDAKIREAASEYAAGAVAKVDSVLAQLKSVDLKPVNALIDTNSSYIDNMLAAVAKAGTTSAHNGINGTITMEEVLSAVAPGQTAFGVEIQVLNKNDSVVKTYKKENFRQQGSIISVQEFEDMYNELLAQIPNSKYYVVNKTLPTEDVKLTADTKTFTSSLRPMTYTVKIDGEADQILYALDAYTITLPGTGSAGHKYVYTIGSSNVEVYSGAVENFALATSIEALDELFGSNRELVITRKLIDVNKDNFLKFISNFNNAFSNAGFTFDNKLALALIPLEDKEGNLSVVMRVTSKYSELNPASLASEMMALIQDLSYVGINGSPLFGLNSDNELKLYVQTIINMLVNGGIGLDTLTEIIDDNGNIKELSLGDVSAVGANNNTIVLQNGNIINDVNALGGKLMESTMQFGVNINNATSAPFYVTYQDFDTQADQLKKVKKGAQQIIPYMNISCKDGAVNLMLNAPDSAYAYIMAALLITGEVDFSTIQSYELDAVLEYITGLIKPMFEDENTDFDTFINTIKQTGFYDSIDGFDFEANRALVEFVYDSIDNLFDNTSATGSSEGALYSGVLTYDALDMLFNNKVALADYKDMIAEVETGLSLPITFKLKNRETEYEALVLDIRGEGITNKYYMARNAASAISNAKDGAVVVLLSDVRGDIVFNNNVTLNLNGYSIIGDLTAKGRAVIVDSTLDTKKCGSVIGDLKVAGGSYKIAAGKFLTDISKYLENGYYLENGIVSNGCFNIVEENNNIDIYLGTDYASLDKSAAKVMATDLISKIIMNFYACSELRVDDNGIYETKLLNITESLNNLSVLIGKMIECIDSKGSSAFATQFMADVTDFASLADAIDNEEALISYTIQQSAFNPYMQYEEDGDFFSFNLTSSDDKKLYRISVFVSDEVDAGQKDKMSAILRELDKITNFDKLEVDINDITYDDKGFSMEGSLEVDVEFDLSTSVDYPVIIAAMLAYDASGAERTEIVNAIKAYQLSNSTKPLMKVIDSMSIAELVSALKNTKSKSFASILSTLGLSSDTAIQTEAHYTIARKVAGTLIEYAKINGNDKTLGGLKVSGEFNTYAYRIAKSDDTYVQVALKIFSEEKAITVKDKNGIIYLNTDDFLTALDNIKEGCTIYVNDAVELSKNVTLPAASFAIAGAENIKFNGNKFWFANSKTVLKTDMDISACVTNDASIFCSKVDFTKDGEWFVFSLKGDQHEWEVIPAVEPSCGKTGNTEGVWCKQCHKYQDGKEPTELPALEHKYNAVVTDPTCFEEGFTVYTCENCGDSYVNDYKDATNHVGTTEVIPGKAATCTEDGLTDGLHCTACGTVFQKQEVIPAHHIEEAYDKDPTCTEPGVSGGTKCSVCGEIVKAGSVVLPNGHNVTIVPGKPATCTENGYTESAYCSVCGHVHVAPQVIISEGHKIVNVEGKEPTCTEVGYTASSYCEVCNEVFEPQTPLAPKGHTPEVIPGKDATVTETGLTEGSRCSVCNEILVPQQVIAKLPYINIPAPRIEANGTIRGAKVDATKKQIFLDVNPDGFTAAEFVKVNFPIDNAVESKISVYNYNGQTKRADSDLVCTGDTVVVWAKNKDGVETSVTYNVIIVGDVNCDGKANSRDTVLISFAFMDQITLNELALTAADVNFDGKLNSRDAVVIANKYVLWPENEYVSQTK